MKAGRSSTRHGGWTESSGSVDFTNILQIAASQANAFGKRERSRASRDYAAAMEKAAVVLRAFTRAASFDQLLEAEQVFQRNDRNVYARAPSTLEAVQKGMRDFDAGKSVYKQILENPEAYRAHRYREDDHAFPDRVVPLDAMRKALRGQISRVGNYRKTVLGNSQEYDFMTARIAMLRRAEKLYDAIQRERLSIPGADG